MISVYVHIPFCRTRCAYCDFNTFAGKERLLPDYVSALIMEIHAQRGEENEDVGTIYFGGGTPSRLPLKSVGEIMSALRETFSVAEDAEITFELNPCDVTESYAAGLQKLGINRVSLGMQSAIPEELRSMGRRHTAEQTAEAVGCLRKAGIRNLSLDLIYGYPGQTQESWGTSLEAALRLKPEHLSLYALNVEEGSILYRQLLAGKRTLPEDGLTVAQYEMAAERLSMAGYSHYEISNWALEEAVESRHNCQYWRVEPYYGFGAGAHGWVNHCRIRNCGSIENYICMVHEEAGNFPAAEELTPQPERVEMQDFMMLGLRMLREGIDTEKFCRRFGKDPEVVFRKELRHLRQKALIHTASDGHITLDPKWVPVANQAFMEFVD